MFTSHAFRLYNIETFFSTHPNAMSYCSAVTPNSSKISDSVISYRSLIVIIKESILSKSFLFCFTMVSSSFFSERTILVLSHGAKGALNLHITPFFFLQVVV